MSVNNNTTAASADILTDGQPNLVISPALYAIFLPSGFVTIILNGVIVVILLKYKHLQTTTSLILGTLAATDMAFGLQLVSFVITRGIMETVDRIYCACSVFLTVALYVLQLELYGIVTLDRFLAITQPGTHMTWMLMKRCQTLLGTAVVYATVLGVAAGIQGSYYFKKTCVIDKSLNKYFVYFVAAHQITLSVVLTWSYWKIFVTTAKQRRVWAVRRQVQGQHSASMSTHKTSMKTTRMVVLIVVTSLVCQLPTTVHMILGNATDAKYNALRQVRTVGLILNALLDPIIYTFKNKELRKSMKLLLRRSAQPDVAPQGQLNTTKKKKEDEKQGDEAGRKDAKATEGACDVVQQEAATPQQTSSTHVSTLTDKSTEHVDRLRHRQKQQFQEESDPVSGKVTIRVRPYEATLNPFATTTSLPNPHKRLTTTTVGLLAVSMILKPPDVAVSTKRQSSNMLAVPLADPHETHSLSVKREMYTNFM